MTGPEQEVRVVRVMVLSGVRMAVSDELRSLIGRAGPGKGWGLGGGVTRDWCRVKRGCSVLAVAGEGQPCQTLFVKDPINTVDQFTYRFSLSFSLSLDLILLLILAT